MFQNYKIMFKYIPPPAKMASLQTFPPQGFKIHASIECHPELIEKTTLTFKKGPARRVKVVCLSFDEVINQYSWSH